MTRGNKSGIIKGDNIIIYFFTTLAAAPAAQFFKVRLLLLPSLSVLAAALQLAAGLS